MTENRIASTAMHTAPVFITSRNVSKVLDSAGFPDIPTSTEEDATPWSVNMTIMNARPNVWSLSDSDLDVILGLIGGGANVGLANPNYLRLLQYALPSRKINVSGIGNSRLNELRIGTFAGTVMTSCGRQVLLIFNEYGEMDNGEGSDGGQIVHSKMQLEDGGCLVNDRPLQLMGEQNIVPTTVEGYTIPITYVNGLPHVQTTYPTDAQLDTLPRIVMTKETPWNPRRYDGDQAAGSTFTDVYTPNRDEEAYYLDEEVIGEAGERVIEIEDEDNEDLIQELDEDDEDSQDELPSLVNRGANGSIAIPFRDIYGLSDCRTKIPRVPRSFQQALAIDKENGNSLWEDAMKREMQKMEALFGDDFQFYRYTQGAQDSWIHFTDNAELCTFKPLYLSFGYKRDGANLIARARVVSDSIGGNEPHALCIRNFWIETLRRRIRSDDIARVFRVGGPFDRYDPYDCCSHRGFCRCTNGGLLALIELIEDGLVENEMGFAESPAYQMMQARANGIQGSVEPRIREMYDRVHRIREQIHTDTRHLEIGNATAQLLYCVMCHARKILKKGILIAEDRWIRSAICRCMKSFVKRRQPKWHHF
eukprot:scaffold520_cov88-Skeletonema_dohrnii-CCMP3373.AAC.1